MDSNTMTSRPVKGLGGRPKKAEAQRRVKQTSHRWTLDEHAYISKQADATGLSVAEHVRRCALGQQVQPKAPIADGDLIAQVNALGVNLNQLARSVNSGREARLDWQEQYDRLSELLDILLEKVV